MEQTFLQPATPEDGESVISTDDDEKDVPNPTMTKFE